MQAAAQNGDVSKDAPYAMQAAAQEGDTAPPALEDVVDLHFVALVNRNSRLVELDGRKSFPIDHGKTSAHCYRYGSEHSQQDVT